MRSLHEIDHVWAYVHEIDHVWAYIASETVKGNLGPGAKVAPCGGNSSDDVLICVYVKAFWDVADCLRIMYQILSGFPHLTKRLYAESSSQISSRTLASNAIIRRLALPRLSET